VAKVDPIFSNSSRENNLSITKEEDPIAKLVRKKRGRIPSSEGVSQEVSVGTKRYQSISSSSKEFEQAKPEKKKENIFEEAPPDQEEKKLTSNTWFPFKITRFGQ
jgi:hypothetical protein